MTNILMVCLGNICRSPLAEGILKSKLPADSFFIDSAGTSNYHIGKSPDKRSIAIAAHYGIDINLQKARQFTSKDFERFDYIYAMDNTNYRNILELARTNSHKNKVKLILNESFPEENLEVPDPYYDSDSGFDNVYKMLNIACNILSKKLNI